jgi:xanthosine utilization system XapX-like protein
MFLMYRGASAPRQPTKQEYELSMQFFRAGIGSARRASYVVMVMGVLLLLLQFTASPGVAIVGTVETPLGVMLSFAALWNVLSFRRKAKAIVNTRCVSDLVGTTEYNPRWRRRGFELSLNRSLVLRSRKPLPATPPIQGATSLVSLLSVGKELYLLRLNNQVLRPLKVSREGARR